MSTAEPVKSTTRITNNGKTYSYMWAHMWMYKNYGKANYCEINPNHRSKKFEWSNISKKYKLERGDWRQLCHSCHLKVDMTESKLKRLQSMNVGSQSYWSWKPVAKCDKQSKEILEIYASITHASILNGIKPLCITNAINGWSKSAGGFVWMV